MTIAQQLEQKGFERGIAIAQQLEQKGIQKGMQQGEAIVLERQLQWRFGKIPSKYLHQIGAANSEVLLSWSKRILDAATIEEVFA